MPSNPLATLPASTTLGMTLLGLSATLLAADIAGTIVLSDDSHAVVATAVTPPAREAWAPQLQQMPAHAHPTVSHAQLAVTAVAPIHVHAVRRASAPGPERRRETPKSRADIRAASRPAWVAAVDARHVPLRVPAVALLPPPRMLVGQGGNALHVLAASATPPFSPLTWRESTSHSPSAVHAPLATSRDVRHFVMRALQRSDRHLCVISAMTYSGHADHVIANIVYRDRRGRWWAKAVVARHGTSLTLVGVKRHALPYQTVATTVEEP